MTEAQLWSVVSTDSCVLRKESYPDWPATNDRTPEYYCTSEPGVLSPSARFYLTDGTLTEKYRYRLT